MNNAIPLRVGGYLGLLSLSLLAYQVLVTRVLSTLLLYHYAFVVASFSICGMGFGALLVGRWSALRARYQTSHAATLTVLGVTLSVSLAASGALLALGNFDNPFYYALGTSFPYVVGGVSFTLLLQDPNLIPGRTYAWDLAGAVLGILATILGLDAFGMLRCWFILPMVPLVASLLVSRQRFHSSVLLVTSLALFAGASALRPQTLQHLEQSWPSYLSSPRKFYGKLARERGPEQLRIVQTEWNSFSRTDVIELRGEPDRKAVTIDGVAYSGMYRFDGNLETLRQYPDDAGYLPSIGHVPFAYGQHDDVLILGSGAGRDLLYAIAHGSRSIDAVELNRASVRATRDFGAFNGALYDRPEVKTYIEDGRGFIEHTSKRYDLIVLTLIKTEATSLLGLSLAEDYLLTREAFRQYLEHLKTGGTFALFVHHEAALAKATATALLALKDLGIPDTSTPDHVAVFTSHKLDPNQEVYQPLLLVSPATITQEQARALAVSAETHDNLSGYLPQLREAGRLAEVKAGTVSVEQFPQDLPFNAVPATDDAPFFYRFDSTFSDMFVPALVGATLAGLLVAAPLLASPPAASLAAYFAAIGFGFMAIETLLVQRLGRYLSHPTYAFGLTVCALLIGSTFGSLLSETAWFARRRGKRSWTALTVSVYLILLGFVLSRLPLWANVGLAGRCTVVLVLLMPLGLLLGTLLPLGVKGMRESGVHALPVLIALSGVASVLGTLATVCMSMYVGFHTTQFVIATLYLSIFLVPLRPAPRVVAC